MNNEWIRYQSFKDFPQSSSVSPIRLAKSGFYYTGTREDTTCFCCGLTIGTWTTDETVSGMHQRLSPHCRYLTCEDRTNVAIHGAACSEQYMGAAIEVGNVSTSNSENIKSSPSQSVTTTSGANGSYRDEGNVQDCVRCFVCGGGMKNWENGDNAWIEHARWFPDCAYVKQCKGDNFVNMCRMANINNMTADGEMQNMATEGLNLAGGKEFIEDQMVQDLNSTASKLVLDMGYMQEDVENAITLAREKYGSSELRAQYILESLLDNSYSNNVNNIPVYNNQTDRDRQSAVSECSLDNTHVEGNIEPLDIKDDHTKLLEENRQLKNQMICKICLDKNACVVFLPCGHMVSCVECAHALRKCAVCRSVIQGSVRAYPV